MTFPLPALEHSVEHLRQLAGSLQPDQFTQQAYPTKWTIADVMSHIGSGAVIFRNTIDSVAAGTDVAEGFNQSVWDEWNAKSPAAKVADTLVADAALIDRVAALSDDQRAALQFSLGPFTLDLAGFLGLRLNEHALHTWDVEVAVEPSASLPDDAAASIVDNLTAIVGFGGKTDGNVRTIHVHTTQPTRDLVIDVGAERLALTSSDASSTPDVELPAEAFIRLVYGRLDPAHTPAGARADDLDSLRKLFPGF